MKAFIQALGNVIFKMPQGFYVTIKYFFKKPVTLDYPRRKKPMAPRYRGRHYLERYDNGEERCVCCGLCAAACPADAIYMEPEENERGERRARLYEINLLRCIFCGFCENSFIWTREQMLVPHPRQDNPFKRIYRRVRRVYGITDKSQ